MSQSKIFNPFVKTLNGRLIAMPVIAFSVLLLGTVMALPKTQQASDYIYKALGITKTVKITCRYHPQQPYLK